MPYYLFTIRKNDVKIEVRASEPGLIADQLEKWLLDILKMKSSQLNKPVETREKVNIRETYRKLTESKSQPVKEIKQQEEPKPEIVVPVKEIKKEEPQKEEKPAKKVSLPRLSFNLSPKKAVEIVREETPLINKENAIEEIEKIIQETEEIQEIAEIRQEPEIIITAKTLSNEEEIVIESLAADEIDLYEDDDDEMLLVQTDETPEAVEVKEIKKIEEAKVIQEPMELVEEIESSAESNFDSLLQKKIKSLPEEINKIAKSVSEEDEDFFSELTGASKTSSNPLEKLIENKKPSSLLEYLMIAAFYLKEYEHTERYSLKQINSKIISYTQKPIDHTVLQKAVSMNYLEVIPDFTGMGGVTEYSITEKGEEYILNE